MKKVSGPQVVTTVGASELPLPKPLGAADGLLEAQPVKPFWRPWPAGTR